MIGRPNLDVLYASVSRQVGSDESAYFTADKEVKYYTGTEIIWSIAGMLISAYLKGFLEAPMKNAGSKSWTKLANIIEQGLGKRRKVQEEALNRAHLGPCPNDYVSSDGMQCI